MTRALSAASQWQLPASAPAATATADNKNKDNININNNNNNNGMPSDQCLTMDALLAALGVGFYKLEFPNFASWLFSTGVRFLNVRPTAAAAAVAASADGAASAAAGGPSLESRVLQRRVLWLISSCLYPLDEAAYVRVVAPRATCSMLDGGGGDGRAAVHEVPPR
jgi:hypothetical protein